MNRTIFFTLIKECRLVLEKDTEDAEADVAVEAAVEVAVDVAAEVDVAVEVDVFRNVVERREDVERSVDFLVDYLGDCFKESTSICIKFLRTFPSKSLIFGSDGYSSSSDFLPFANSFKKSSYSLRSCSLLTVIFDSNIRDTIITRRMKNITVERPPITINAFQVIESCPKFCCIVSG